MTTECDIGEISRPMKTQKIDILTYTLIAPGRTLGRNNGENE